MSNGQEYREFHGIEQTSANVSMLTSDLLVQATDSKLMGCMKACVVHPNCFSFLYNAKLQLCRTFGNTARRTNENGLTGSDWTYYELLEGMLIHVFGFIKILGVEFQVNTISFNIFFNFFIAHFQYKHYYTLYFWQANIHELLWSVVSTFVNNYWHWNGSKEFLCILMFKYTKEVTLKFSNHLRTPCNIAHEIIKIEAIYLLLKIPFRWICKVDIEIQFKERWDLSIRKP